VFFSSETGKLRSSDVGGIDSFDDYRPSGHSIPKISAPEIEFCPPNLRMYHEKLSKKVTKDYDSVNLIEARMDAVKAYKKLREERLQLASGTSVSKKSKHETSVSKAEFY
jgi:hypothetical protein